MKVAAADAVAAVDWYRQAAEKGHERAMCNLGLCYKSGKGVAKDAVAAVDWFQQAAAKGHEG